MPKKSATSLLTWKWLADSILQDDSGKFIRVYVIGCSVVGHQQDAQQWRWLMIQMLDDSHKRWTLKNFLLGRPFVLCSSASILLPTKIPWPNKYTISRQHGPPKEPLQFSTIILKTGLLCSVFLLWFRYWILNFRVVIIFYLRKLHKTTI